MGFKTDTITTEGTETHGRIHFYKLRPELIKEDFYKNRGGRELSKLIYKEESFQIRGAVFEVYKEKGCGFLEPVYQECMEKELELSKIPFQSQKELGLSYKGETLKQKYIPDFICFDKIIVELKSVSELIPKHRAQLMNYLKATGFKLGLLVNFGSYPKVEIERIVL